MKKFSILFICFLELSFLLSSVLAADSQHFIEGKQLYDNKDFDNSKTFFERDIVFNPKNEKSYLYLAKIFKEKENLEEHEMKLNSVITLNPKNEEAIYMLIALKLSQSDIKKVKELLENFKMVCRELCEKNKELEEKFKRLEPDNVSN